MVDVDDAFAAWWSSRTAPSARSKPRRFCAGHKNYNVIEINGEKGAIRFDLERMNELEVFWVDDQPKETQGFHTVSVTEGYHPFISNWWPHGHIIGWEHTFVHEINHLLDCIVNDKSVAPLGAHLRGRLSQQRDLRRASCSRPTPSGRSISSTR